MTDPIEKLTAREPLYDAPWVPPSCQNGIADAVNGRVKEWEEVSTYKSASRRGGRYNPAMAVVRRLKDQEINAALAVMAARGGTSRSRDSWDHDRMTALVLADGETLEALMPMAKRMIRAAPGRTLEAGWLSSNQFASRMSWRRQSRGTETHWPALLPEVDALIVTRRDEQALLSGGGGASAGRYRQAGYLSMCFPSVACIWTWTARGLAVGVLRRRGITCRWWIRRKNPGMPGGGNPRWRRFMRMYTGHAVGRWLGTKISGRERWGIIFIRNIISFRSWGFGRLRRRRRARH